MAALWLIYCYCMVQHQFSSPSHPPLASQIRIYNTSQNASLSNSKQQSTNQWAMGVTIFIYSVVVFACLSTLTAHFFKWCLFFFLLEAVKSEIETLKSPHCLFSPLLVFLLLYMKEKCQQLHTLFFIAHDLTLWMECKRKEFCH